MNKIKIFSGNSNIRLSKAISKKLKVSLGKLNIKRFSDGEIFVEVDESVRGSNAYVIQSTSGPVNENLMELFIIVDALKRAAVNEITAVIPYFGYSRQDRKVTDRSPITARLVCDLLIKSGIQKIVTMDLHAGQIQGFFDIPVDHLYSSPIAINYIKKKFKNKDFIIASPDAGGMERARAFAKKLNDADLAMTDKRRPAPNVAEITNVIGDVQNKHVILIDDLIDTGGTAAKSAEALVKSGAKSVSMFCTHGVLSGNAIENIGNSCIDELIITDTIDNQEKLKKSNKIKVLTVSTLIAEAINRIRNNKSISQLFS
ncbi:MAG: ribose-phosphate pyrophosphokinase [Thermodesulfobacteriota bacterium]|nr:ribose-phosphate pyrophosphokinase [Deltaproteobacteria bacterium TMED58]RZP16547.1 MAG: ribose-phosphate pyrophosphokinase [Candidatus Dadabacteria bacterium]|tara:strand:+ start:24342 stop:25286 length:945 start_codon:yes stop_codon:yes gene_type:complete